MSLKADVMIVAGIAIAVFATGYYARKKIVDVGGTVLNAVNPLNNDNIINEGFTGFYQAVTGSTGTLGTDIYDLKEATAWQLSKLPDSADPVSDTNGINFNYF